jgi:large subunit ribosomal protein L1
MIEKCTQGFQDFDVAVATPGAMAEARKLGKVLGPRGLMPNPKTGTVTEDTAKAVQVKAGRVGLGLDKNGNAANPVGTRRTAARGERRRGYRGRRQGAPGARERRLRWNVTLSATMLPGVKIDASFHQILTDRNHASRQSDHC